MSAPPLTPAQREILRAIARAGSAVYDQRAAAAVNGLANARLVRVHYAFRPDRRGGRWEITVSRPPR
jgi:hypothetical protein